MSTAPLKTATQSELVEYLNAQAAKIQSLQATVDIDTSVGGIKKGKITDYKQIRGYVLARKPAVLRMIGLMPVVRNRAFDMVSEGQNFKLWIPPKNRFIVGRNDVVTRNPDQPLENIRPQQIYDAILIPAISKDEIAVAENNVEVVTDGKGHKVQQADYVLNVIGKGKQGWFLSRKIVFSRTDLLPHRQYVYDEEGNLATDARYEKYQEFDGQMFPAQIGIWRPQEEYDITLSILKLQINTPLPDDKFSLEQPEGAQVVHLDKPPASGTKPH
ncbi:MAG: DUF4292 domain-containing protein [Acidobacteria bacterium]|nr:DUF4292 domain-containing protein [Acidobacteriota bacterium]